MSLDTKYRPTTFDDVIGQDSTVKILRQYVKSGAGFHQSYLFSGPWGSGKTTVARIHGRALLCASPVEGAPCDHCTSCRSILEGGTSEMFFEIDAATNSGKDSIRKITEGIQYNSYSGKRPIYLMDESHRLSKDALDALLKPLEDTVPDGEDKQLVCLFCTTEPEGMRNTILSRCAPAFVIKPVTPDQLADRLVYVCEKEAIEYEREALVLIGELTECHFRDALKAIEGVSMLGAVTTSNVSKYLHLDYSTFMLNVLADIRSDLPSALKTASTLMKTMSPITVYERLSELAMMAYRTSLGDTSAPGYLDKEVIKGLGENVGEDLLVYASKFSSRPGRPTSSMVLCDIAQLHRGPGEMMFAATSRPAPVKKIQSDAKVPGKVDTEPKVVDNVYIHPRAVNHKNDPPPAPKTALPQELRPQEFFRFVAARAAELKSHREREIGQERRDDMGHPGVDQDGGGESSGGNASGLPEA